MNLPIAIEDIVIRTELRPGDIGYVTYLHGDLYKKEYGYGIAFEAYVAQGFYEFYSQYDPGKDRKRSRERPNLKELAPVGRTLMKWLRSMGIGSSGFYC
jgi:hypothetical protein